MLRTLSSLAPVLALLVLAACTQSGREATTASDTTSTDAMTDAPDSPDAASDTNAPSDDPSREIATFGAGCFWCVEAVLEQIEGVHDVVSGYMGGEVADPTYKEVCTGTTGHAEVVQVHFDPSVIGFADLVELFWDLHDPTTLNRQGADVGTQYRSAIFYHSEAQREAAVAGKAAANPRFDGRIVTEITAASTFYEAEDYHQDYYFANREQPYCRAVISPKLKKLGLKH